MVTFPDNFFWGAATSSYQVEGDNTNSDWWEWEKRAGLKEVSGSACRHYELYREDFDLAKALNHNCHRLSVEWSRIEPQQNIFSEKEIAHYKDVIGALRKRDITPVVTLHHFTNPLWVARAGGWENKKTIGHFLVYVEKIVSTLCCDVRFWVTINEPLVYIYHSYVLGAWPPQEKSLLKAKCAQSHMLKAHILAYRLIQRIYRERQLSAPSISIASNLQAFMACSPNLVNKFAAFIRDKYFNFYFLEKALRSKAVDFIGVNYYTRSLVEVEKFNLMSLLLDTCRKGHQKLLKNSLGWDIYPEGLYSLLLKLKKFKLPVFILENGICSEDDNLRWDFISGHLRQCHLAMQQGVDVIGYIYWSLLDNYEWDKGFGPRFGLVEVDYKSFARTVRESARKLALVAKTGALG